MVILMFSHLCVISFLIANCSPCLAYDQGGGCCIEFLFFPNCICFSALYPLNIYKKVDVYSLWARPLCLVVSPLQFHSIIIVIGCIGCFLTRFYSCYSYLDYSFLGCSISFSLALIPISEIFCVFFALFVFVFPLYVSLYQSITFSPSFIL